MATKPNELLDKITPQGIDFINYVCTPNSNDRLTGSWNYPMTNGTIKRKEVLTAHVIDHEGNVVTNNKQLANALIFWYNKYGKDFNINPNIIRVNIIVVLNSLCFIVIYFLRDLLTLSNHKK